MKRVTLHFTGTSPRILLFAFVLVAGLVAIGLWAFRASLLPPPPVLTGTYRGDDKSIYYVQRSANTLWWMGVSLDKDKELSAELQWHRGLDYTNVFRGTINSDNTVTGEWVDVPRGASLDGGTLTIRVSSSGGAVQFTRIAATGNFRTTTWHKTDPLDDLKFNGVTTDIVSRFRQVHKNVDGETILRNLEPYRDQTVVYGRLINSHLEYLNDNCVESEVPHVNYGPADPKIFQGSDKGQCGHEAPLFLHFGRQSREFDDFACFHADDGDADFDMRLKVDKLEQAFYTTGWGDHASGAAVFLLKLTDKTTRDKLGFADNGAYMGLEAIMYGRPGICDDGQASPVNGGKSMLPGWADLSSNSVLINGRPINGVFGRRPPVGNCDFFQPCPLLIGYNGRNILDIPAGIRLGDLLLSAHGNGQVDADNNVGEGLGTYVRVTGTLVLDCGHAEVSDSRPCYDRTSHPDEVSSHSNQEIHPIYSIDVITSPYRPEDTNMPGATNLTGTYGGSDGSTYYVRQTGSTTNIHQLGRTIWWVGLMRDRQPMQSGGSPMIGSEQLGTVNLGDQRCLFSQCWAFANVFKGTITESSGETVIEGDWAGVPQSTSPGSSGGHQKFSVSKNKIIQTSGLPAVTIFPTTIEKMYDSQETGSAGNLP